MKKLAEPRSVPLLLAILATLMLVPLPGYPQTAARAGPYGILMTGRHVPGMQSYDRVIARVVHDFDIPGAAVAVVRHGRLVYARGFGTADREAGTPVQPDSLFRIASLSKPITAVAVLKLIEDSLLDLDDRVFREVLTDDSRSLISDSRMNDITVRDLLRHSAGFDTDLSDDPQFMQEDIARILRTTTPLECADVITYMKARRLDFAPGHRYAYSNFGYCILGRIIEQVSGLPYEHYVRQEILQPAGAVHMRVAAPFLSGRLEKEVKYYDYPGAELSQSLDPGTRTRVPWPYNGFLSTMDAHGGWASSVVDLLRFVNAVDGRYSDDIITHETVDLMVDRPPYEQGVVWYGLGWSVRDIGQGESNWWHAGSMPGTSAILVRAGNGYSWAAVMNSRSEDWEDLQYAIDVALWDAFDQVTRWPRHDLFSQAR